MEEEKKQIEEKLLLCEKERDEYLNGWKRAKADLINSKKEFEDQIKNLNDFVKIEFVKQFLPVLDALEGAKEIEGWRGVKKLVEDVLNRNGVEEVESLGEEFDPIYHEAVGESEGDPNKVIEVLQKGYKINGRVIRAARVKIGKSDTNTRIHPNDANRVRRDK
ncbi:MAG: nucleotide exchange factor GrpE [Parcubacteria group bacterium]|nr:nucleotide exchange factor GrpE [Parcubacteria group bacterium]